MPIVRRVVWDWKATQPKGGAKGPLFFDWPIIDVRYFVTTPDQRNLLDELVKEIQVGLTRIEPETDGLQLDFWYGEEEEEQDEDDEDSDAEVEAPDEEAGASEGLSGPTLLTSLRYLEIGSMPMINLSFPPGWQPDLDAAWVKCWDALQSICADEQAVDCETFYNVTPEELARALEPRSAAKKDGTAIWSWQIESS